MTGPWIRGQSRLRDNPRRVKCVGTHAQMRTYAKKHIVGLLFSLLFAAHCYGYLLVPYESLKKMSDLIVIAVPVENMDTTNRWSVPASPHDIPVVGVETRFQILTVLKGELEGKKFVLTHYKYAGPEFRPGRVGPSPLTFDVAKQNRFLMFLKRDNGKIVPVLRTDTAWSVKMISDDRSP
jgi:hypothetical protein